MKRLHFKVKYMNFSALPGPSRKRPFDSPPDPTMVARCSWLLKRLFPAFSQIFLHTLLEARDFDLLSTLETLVDLLQNRSFNVPYPGAIPTNSVYSSGMTTRPALVNDIRMLALAVFSLLNEQKAVWFFPIWLLQLHKKPLFRSARFWSQRSFKFNSNQIYI